VIKTDCLPEFEKELKKLSKKYRTLETDLKIFISVQLRLFHELNQDNGGIVNIAGLGIEDPKIYKARKFACRALSGTGSNSGIRIIYAYFAHENRVRFIEIYYKGDKAMEDRDRISKHFKK
jgi:mRNA-degrading endonuclease RelE of RelBE toxin-antitoxin system